MLAKMLKVATEPISQTNFQNNLSCRKSGALRLKLKFTLHRNYVNQILSHFNIYRDRHGPSTYQK